MKAEINIKEREHGGAIEIQLPNNGSFYRITYWNEKDEIVVSTVDGSMSILPSVSNQVKIITNK